MTAKVDSKGRVIIPNAVREKILIDPLRPIANKYHGIFRTAKRPEDFDECINEAIKPV